MRRGKVKDEASLPRLMTLSNDCEGKVGQGVRVPGELDMNGETK
jgi:hypothetical protein